MSLINEMLRDLEARKREQAVAKSEADAHTLSPALDPRRDDGGRSSDLRVWRRLRWLLPAWFGALATLAVGLYLAFAGRGGVLERDSLARALRTPIEPAAPASVDSPPVATVAAPVSPSRLILLAVEQGEAGQLRLLLRFAPALHAPLRVDASEGRVSIRAEGVDTDAVESPSPLLRDWRSERDGETWRAQFRWDGTANVELQPMLEKDASQGWLLQLLPAPARASTSAPAKSSAAVTPVAAVPASSPPDPAAERARYLQTLYADAWRLQQAGQTAQAIERLQRLLEIAPDDERGRELIARLYLRQGDRASAIAVLRNGLARVPGQPRWIELLARVLDGGGRREQAVELLRSAGSERVLEHQVLLGAMATQSGQWETAAAAYRRALALAPGEARWWLGLGFALDKQGDALAAQAAYQGALDAGGLSPDNVRYVRSRLSALTHPPGQ